MGTPPPLGKATKIAPSRPAVAPTVLTPDLALEQQRTHVLDTYLAAFDCLSEAQFVIGGLPAIRDFGPRDEARVYSDFECKKPRSQRQSRALWDAQWSNLVQGLATPLAALATAAARLEKLRVRSDRPYVHARQSYPHPSNPVRIGSVTAPSALDAVESLARLMMLVFVNDGHGTKAVAEYQIAERLMETGHAWLSGLAQSHDVPQPEFATLRILLLREQTEVDRRTAHEPDTDLTENARRLWHALDGREFTATELEQRGVVSSRRAAFDLVAQIRKRRGKSAIATRRERYYRPDAPPRRSV